MRKSPALVVEEDPIQALRAELVEGLEGGRWPAGSRLPTERALCESFGVSRSALRRVLLELRRQGLIVQRVGSGTYVAPARTAVDAGRQGLGRTLSVPPVSPAEVIDARLQLEPAMVELIVNNATSEDLERLQAYCERSERAETPEEFERCDSALHAQLACATHNVLFVSIFELLAEIRDSGEWGVLKKKTLSVERRKVLQAKHRRIVDALCRRDAQAARQELFEHIAEARLNLLRRL